MLVFHTLNLCFQVLQSSVNPGKACSYIRELLIFFAKKAVLSMTPILWRRSS